MGRYYNEAIDNGGVDYLFFGAPDTGALVENKKVGIEMEKPAPSKAVLDLREIAADFDGDRIAEEEFLLSKIARNNEYAKAAAAVAATLPAPKQPSKGVLTDAIVDNFRKNAKKFVYDINFENKIKKGRRKNKSAALSRKRNRK
jgi:hypothetical protein